MKSIKKLSPSLENYLEAILFLETKNRVARVKDIADMMQVQMSSVTAALKNLKDKQLVNYEKNSFISLSDNGKKIAQNTRKKHDIIKSFLTGILKLPAAEADKAACEIEHSLAIDAALRLKNCSDFVSEKIAESGISDSEWEKLISK